MPRRKQEKKEPEAAVAGGESKRITPVEIQQKEFGLAFRGYNERDVDQFLDEVTEEVARLYAENKRLREEVEFTRTSRLDIGGAEAAEALLRQAREEAARLLADARARVSAVAPDQEAPTGRGAAAALAPFVAQEREFLQSLANLIQTHAEAVKEQIRRARDAAATAATRDASTQAAIREAAVREAEAREAAARAALEEEAAARAAFRAAAAQEAAMRSEPSSDYVEAEKVEEVPGHTTQPWDLDEVQASAAQDRQDWRGYYASPEDEGASEEARAEASDEILDLTQASGDRSDSETEERSQPEPARRQLEPQRAAREADSAEEDSLEDRSIRELFWGEDY